MPITVSDRLEAFIDYEERCGKQAIVDLRGLLADIRKMERERQEMASEICRLMVRIRELESKHAAV